jgi:hypothetical protein
MTKKTTGPAQGKLITIDYGRLRAVSGVVQLQDVILNRAAFDSLTEASHDTPATGSVELSIKLTGAQWGYSAEAHLLKAYLEYRLTAVARPAQEGVGDRMLLFGLVCEWMVRFGVPDGYSLPPDDVMGDFTVANGQLNAHPYVRQFIQDVTGRAGWMPVILPTFRIPATRAEGLGSRRVDK